MPDLLSKRPKFWGVAKSQSEVVTFYRFRASKASNYTLIRDKNELGPSYEVLL